MTFEEAAERYRQLQAAYAAGQLAPPDFQAQVEQLVVTDASGVWWRLDPSSGQWLAWNGTAWAPAGGAAPPAAAQPAAAAQVQHAAAGKWSQRVWDAITIVGSAAMAYGMYYYSTLDKYAKPDTTTPVLMVAIPLGLILLRKPLDRLLRPMQGFRAKIPALMLVGIGLLVPFLVARALYPKYTEFGYLRRSYVISTLLSYVVLRTPPPLRSEGEPS